MRKVDYKKLFEKLSLEDKVRVNQPRTYKIVDGDERTMLAIFCSEADFVLSMNDKEVKEQWQRALELDGDIYVTASDYPVGSDNYEHYEHYVCKLESVFEAKNAFALNECADYRGYVTEVLK